jgi:hypothetical protein
MVVASSVQKCSCSVCVCQASICSAALDDEVRSQRSYEENSKRLFSWPDAMSGLLFLPHAKDAKIHRPTLGSPQIAQITQIKYCRKICAICVICGQNRHSEPPYVGCYEKEKGRG